MKITKNNLQALYPVSEHALQHMEHTLSALPEGKEKIVVKKKLSTAALLAAVLTLLLAGAVAAAIHWDVMQFLYGKPVGAVEPLMEEVKTSATDGRVTVKIGSVAHDGRALAIDWTIESHQPEKPVHLEIACMTIGGKRVWPSAYSSLNCDWLRPGETIRYGGDMLMLPEDTDPETLIAYDIIALRDKDYKDTYGDVNVEIVFGTAYEHEKAMTILAGFPIEDAIEQPFFEWFVLRAEAMIDSDAVEIGLKQLNLPRMEEEPMMLVVISEDLEPELEEQEEVQK